MQTSARHHRPPAPRLPTLALALALPLLVLSCALTGCGIMSQSITGSGRTIPKAYPLTHFSRVTAGHAFVVDLVQGSEYSVTVTLDDNLVDYLDVHTSGSTLHLGLQPHVNLRKATLHARIVLPQLDQMDLSGAARATLSGFNSQGPLKLRLSGASQLRGDIQNGDADFGLSGASHLTLRGRAGALKLDASGASHADLGDYPSARTDVDASGATTIVVNVSADLNAEASGASSVHYLGQPTAVSARASGASSVARK